MERSKRFVTETPTRSPNKRSKSPTPSRAKTPTKYNSTDDGMNIRKCKIIVSYTELQLIIQDLIKNRQRILPCIELHQLLFESRLPPRCIEHNNAVSLYCSNEHKILCVNCVYNTLKHKTHKVNPLKDSISDVRADVAKMEATLQKQYLQVKNQIEISEMNQALLDDTMTKMLEGLQKQFDQISRFIAGKYIQLKTYIIDNYHKVLSSNCVITGQFQWLKSTLDATFINLSKPIDQQHLIRKQLLLTRILQHTGTRCKVLRKQDAESIVGQFSKYLSKIKQKFQVQQWFTF